MSRGRAKQAKADRCKAQHPNQSSSILHCFVLFCSGLSCSVPSCLVLSCPVRVCPGCSVLSCPVLFFLVLLCPVQIRPALPCFAMSCFALSLLAPLPLCPVCTPAARRASVSSGSATRQRGTPPKREHGGRKDKRPRAGRALVNFLGLSTFIYTLLRTAGAFPCRMLATAATQA